MLTVNDIKSVAVEVIDIRSGAKFEPFFEAYGYEKFQEMVAWYRQNLDASLVAYVRGIGYENGERQVLASEFVGVREMATL